MRREVVQLDFVGGQVTRGHKGHQVIFVAFFIEDFEQALRHLKISGASRFHMNCVGDAEVCRARLFIVGFIVHKDDQAVAKAIDFLPDGAERARRLRLLDARDLHIHVQARKIQAVRRIAFLEGIALVDQVGAEFEFKIGSNCLTIRDAEQRVFRVLAFGGRKDARLLAEQRNRKCCQSVLVPRLPLAALQISSDVSCPIFHSPDTLRLMKIASMNSVARLARMRVMFEREGGVLLEDYKHFTRPSREAQPDAPFHPSKAVRNSEQKPGKLRPKPN